MTEIDFQAPGIDYAGISPIISLSVGLIVVLLVGLAKPPRAKVLASLASFLTLGITAGLMIWRWDEPANLVAGALRLDDLAIAVGLIAVASAAFAIPLSWREDSLERPFGQANHGEFQSLLLASVLGMVLLAQAQNLIVFFVALELLSIPLYVLCGSALRRRESLESGLKYLIVGSLGSATLLYGLAFIYGASGSTDFATIANALGADLGDDILVLIGIALCATGLAFKLSIAPFHQWTPDVYQGAPTPVTAFMAVATKAAAFAVFVRFFEVALGPSVDQWQTALAGLAAFSIAVGNVGALGQRSLKRMLGYSGVAQAGYMLVGIVAANEAGVSALVFYLVAYALTNLAAFAVITIRERETEWGDDIRSFQGLGSERPGLAWALTISMLGLAGLPGTVGFIGKLFLINAISDAGYIWLGIAIAIGTVISLAYYLRVVAAIWVTPRDEPAEAPATAARPAIVGGSPELDPPESDEPQTADPREAFDPRAGLPSGGRCFVILGLLLVVSAASVVFGIIPQPLADWAGDAGASIVAAFPG